MNSWVFRRRHDYRVKKVWRYLPARVPSGTIDRSVESTIAYSQSVSLAGSVYSRSLESSLTFSHTVGTGGSVWPRSVTSTVSFGQNVSVKVVYKRSAESTIAFSQSITLSRTKTATSTIVFTQQLSYVLTNAIQANNTIAFAQSLSDPLLSRLSFSQTVSLAGSTYSKSLTSPLALTSKVARAFELTSTVSFTQDMYRVQPTSSTLTIDHAVDVQATRHLINALTLTQAVTYVRVRVEAFSVLNLTQLASYDAVFDRSVTSFWTTLSQKLNPGPRSDVFFRQIVAVKRARFYSASNSIVFDSMVDHSKIEYTSSTLSFAQSVVGQKVPQRSLESLLSFDQTLVLQQLLNKSLSNALTFTQEAVGTKVKRLVILQTPEDIIILPRPLLGDKETSTDALEIKRSMNGVVRTYVKTSSTRKLSYTFSVRTDKALELKMFIEKHPTDVIRMENFKGEIWKVQLTNDPFEFAYDSKWAPCKERVLVTLEFEGTKLYG